MMAVIFAVEPHPDHMQTYLDAAAALRSLLEQIDGFISNVGWLYRLLSGAPAAVDPVLAGRLRTPPPVPTTSIYSRADGVVAWQSCCHAAPAGQVRDIEVKGSHIGMAWNPEVLRVVESLLRTGSRTGA